MYKRSNAKGEIYTIQSKHKKSLFCFNSILRRLKIGMATYPIRHIHQSTLINPIDAKTPIMLNNTIIEVIIIDNICINLDSLRYQTHKIAENSDV